MIPEHRPTRLPVFLASLLSRLYRIGINHQNKNYDQGKGVRAFDIPVISIGNLSTGGTGKTPMVQHVVRLLQDAGRHPMIAMRGYKAKLGEIGDEQREHMEALPGVPIVAQPDRIAGIDALRSTEQGAAIDCVVLDDGFQHRKIARELDVVLIDATRPAYQDSLLPLGFLRETSESLSRADLVVITHAERVEQDQLGDLRRWISGVHPELAVLVTEHRWSGLGVYQAGSDSAFFEGIDYLDGAKVATLTGIGNPEAFVSMATDAGAQIVHRCDCPDHAEFSDGLVRQFLSDANEMGAGKILVSPKDWTKLKSRILGGFWEGALPIVVPQLGLGFRSDQDRLNQLLKAVFSLD